MSASRRLSEDEYLYSQPKTDDSGWASWAHYDDSGWASWAHYDDCGAVMELGAMYDDALKKTEFCYFATRVANAICEELGIKCYCTWGKWGSRIEPKKNDSELDIEQTAQMIINHPAWRALKLATRICTYGISNEEVSEYQWEQSRKFGER